jgi:peptidoglycan hydrolase CwlO-like protein
MKSSLGVLLAAVIVVSLTSFEYWQYRDQQAYRQGLNAQLTDLSARLNSIEARIDIAKDQIDKIQQTSLGGLLESSNNALIEGWSAMINSVEKELERAKKGIARPPRAAQPNSPSAYPAPNNGAGPL